MDTHDSFLAAMHVRREWHAIDFAHTHLDIGPSMQSLLQSPAIEFMMLIHEQPAILDCQAGLQERLPST